MAAAVVAGTGAAVINSTPTIDPMDYITVCYDGYSGDAIAYVSVDYAAFMEDMSNERLVQKNDINVDTMRVRLLETLQSSLSETSDLSNGDKIKLEIDYNPDALSSFGYTLKGKKTAKYTVEGLSVLIYPTSFSDLSDEQIEAFEEIAINEREEYNTTWMTNIAILKIEDLQLSYIGLKYDETSGTTTFYPVFTQVSSSTDGQIEPTEQTLVVEYTNIYYIDDQVNWRNCNLIANDMITSISTGNWMRPVLNILTQEDISEYIRNEEVDGVHYEYITVK